MSYAFDGACDSHHRMPGVDGLEAYSGVDGSTVTLFVRDAKGQAQRELNATELRAWVDGCDPESGERRGRHLPSPEADLLLDGTVNAPKSFSIAAMLAEELAAEFESLQDRLRDRILNVWLQELNARRGAGGRIRENLARIEVVELRHRRSRALDPHIHRHLWLNVRVRGIDGAWSNVDSRVAMRVHNVVNAEGDLAARTDPGWRTALARHGFTIDATGEIAELAHLVRPLSKRSNQIEANRAMFLSEWSTSHPGQVPSGDVLRQADRYAWAVNRPMKLDDFDEENWAAMVREEIRALDSTRPVLAPSWPSRARTSAELDVARLARMALADADQRSMSCNGRFSRLDVRAGAIRAVAASGVIAARDALQPTIDDLVARAMVDCRDLLTGELKQPDHVKALISKEFAAQKQRLGQMLTDLSMGSPRDPSIDGRVTTPCPEDLIGGDAQQAAVVAISGAQRLVTIIGPAGTGKTTLLRESRDVLYRQQRRMLLVAPTRKAAIVAGREVGADAASVHSLLIDHGWRWRRDDAGAAVWWRLEPGDRDPNGRVFRGPSRFPLDKRTRVVVDEAGMLDLQAATALIEVATNAGAGVALVGDPYQASPVGHSGAMAMSERRAGAVVELDIVHRFADPNYGRLTLRLRSPSSRDEAIGLAVELQRLGNVQVVTSAEAARQALLKGFFDSASRSATVALVVSTNEEADLVNEAIQQERVHRGELSEARIALGSGGQQICEGDVVQTRRNDTAMGVENRANWIVDRITEGSITLRRPGDLRDLRSISLAYAADHLQLAYATTVHGIQGETTDFSIVGPGVDASGLYVGLTRGRYSNRAVVVAHDEASACRQLADSMLRGVPEPDLEDAVRGARYDLWRAAKDPRSESRGELEGDSSRTRNRGTAQSATLLDNLGRWLASARSTLLRADFDRATGVAISHGRRSARSGRVTTGGLTTDGRTRLVQLIVDRERQERQLVDRHFAGDPNSSRPRPSEVSAFTSVTTGRSLQ